MEDKNYKQDIEGDNNPPKFNGSLIAYWIIVLLIVSILNRVLFPSIVERSVIKTDYLTFRTMLKEEKISSVYITDQQITFEAKDDSGTKIYKTGKINDPGVIDELIDKNVKFAKEIPETPNAFLSFLLTWGVPIFLFFMFQRMMIKRAGISGGMFQTGGEIKRFVPGKDMKTFEDVAGQEEAEESLKEIVDYLKNPKKYSEIGAKCPRGALLVGPPGTGKTLLAKATAGESHVPFFSIAGSEFIEMFVGRGAAKVRELFDEAKKNAPCIVFIDEIDSIGKRRDQGYGGNDEREQTLNQLLTQMDGFGDNLGIVVLAATNRPEILDPALLRPGRFDRQIRVELPGLEDRVDILKVHARSYKMADNINFNLIARSTAGASGAQLANILNEAALRAVREGHTEVLQEDVQESIELVIAGAQKKNDILSPEEKRLVSYHEIGHALVAAAQKDSPPVEKITIIPRTSGALGYTMQVPEDEKNLYTKEDLLIHLRTLCGGRAAEEVCLNTVTTGASNDIEKATGIARNMITQYGMTETFDMTRWQGKGARYMGEEGEINASEATREKIDEKTVRIVKECHEDAKKIVEDYKEAMDELAEFLLREETITGAQFMEIFKKYKVS